MINPLGKTQKINSWLWTAIPRHAQRLERMASQRARNKDPSVPAMMLVGLKDGVHLPGELIQRGWFAVTLAAGQQGRQLAVIHEDRAERGHGLGPAVGGPVQQGRLADQVADGHVEHLGEGADDRQPVKLDPVVLGPLQPIGRAADQARENFLGHSPAAPVPGHPLANGQVLRHPAHGLTLPAAYRYPGRIFRVSAPDRLDASDTSGSARCATNPT